MSTAKAPKALLNLQRTTVLVADADIMGQNIVVQILTGFGARNIVRCGDLDEVKRQMTTGKFELVIIDPSSFGAEGYELIGWMRRELAPPNRHAPVLVATGHTAQNRIGQLRDGGANFIVSKPMSPAILLDRILWMSREKRPYIETDSYVGPDRRWHDATLPQGAPGRRQKDREVVARIAAGGAMNQADIDLVMNSAQT
ncbi:MAG: response regulator, partial [Hyphomonadaceae bacterium]